MIIERREISAQTAMKLVTAAVEHATLRGFHVAVAVVDPSGAVLASWRMDHVAAPIADFALDKAYTAATMKKSTAAWADGMNASDSLKLGVSTRSRFLTWGGGEPIHHDEALIGAIGVSGAQDFEDIECARAAIASQDFSSSVFRRRCQGKVL